MCELSGQSGTAGAVTASYTWGVDGLLSSHQYAGGGTSYFYQFDPSGNPAQRLTGGGTAVSYAFDGFGAREGAGTSDPASGFSSQWGGYTDAETGLVLLGHRYYDPGTGRFLTRDPMGYAGGINLYAYTQNDPVNRADLSGTSPEEPFPGEHIPTIGIGPTVEIEGEGEPIVIPSPGAGVPGGGGFGDDPPTPTPVVTGAPGGGGPTGGGTGGGGGNGGSGGSGGMLGNASTQCLDDSIASDLENDGWTVTNGAGRGSQEPIKDPIRKPTGRPGRPKGTVFPDITATKNGVTMRIQTVDTLKNGCMTKRELNNLNTIIQRRPGDPIFWFPKNGGW